MQMPLFSVPGLWARAVHAPVRAVRAAGAWCLRPGQAAGVHTRTAMRLRVLEGQLWVTFGATQHPQDHGLGPGQVLVVPAGVHLVMEPLALRGDQGPVRLTLCPHAGTSQATPSGCPHAQ